MWILLVIYLFMLYIIDKQYISISVSVYSIYIALYQLNDILLTYSNKHCTYSCYCN